jgi:hypothetical protein
MPIYCLGYPNSDTDLFGINNAGTLVGSCDNTAFVIKPPYGVGDGRTFDVLPLDCPIAGMEVNKTVATAISNNDIIVGNVFCEADDGSGKIFSFEIPLSAVY